MNTGIIRKCLALTTAMVLTMVMAAAQSDTVRIAALLDTGAGYVLREGNERKDLDSANFFFDRALALSKFIHSDKWINETLKWKGDCFLEGNDLPRGEACFQQVIDYYHHKGATRDEAAIWDRLGQCISNFKPAFSAEKARCFEHARQLYHSLGDTLDEIEALKEEADAHLWEHKLDLAEKELLEVVEGLNAIHSHRLHFTYDLLRAVSNLKGDLVKEILYTMEMVQSMDSSDIKADSGWYKELYTGAAISYGRAGMWDRSFIYARKAWMCIMRGWDDGDFYSCVHLVAAGMLEKDSAREALEFLSAVLRRKPPSTDGALALMAEARGECYRKLKDFGKAGEEYIKMKPYLDRIEKGQHDHTLDLIYLEMNLALGNFYLLTSRYDRAEAYSKKLHTSGDYLISMSLRVKIEWFRSQVDSVMGRYKQALAHFSTYHRLNDSLSGVRKAIQIQELEIKYATVQKDKDLRIQAGDIQLLTKQNQLQQAKAAKSRVFRNMMIICLLVLLSLVALVYNRYRLKQQKNRELEAKQEEISEKNYQLERLLTENEWLLREVHHRVKNNLQVIISLLKSQSSFLHDQAALAAVVESEHRVYAMSLIHQKLYKSNNVSSIDMPEYIGDLVEYLRYSFQGSGKLWFDLQVEPIKLDLKQAVPVGLILNEVITNSFKYAFPWSGEDRITVRLLETGEGWLLLTIADNGRGLPSNFDPMQNESFGMLLIGGLTEDLEGTVHIENNHGTAFHIRFKKASIKASSEDRSQESNYFNK